MTYIDFKTKLLGIQPALECLKFLAWRVSKDDYRGTHKLQHYRWNKEYIKIVLKHLPKDKKLYHTQGDITDGYIYKSDEVEFCEYLAKVNKELNATENGNITDMVMRKIIFVNLQRMGLVDRFNKNGILCDPDKKAQYRYVQITQKGLEILNAKNIFEEIKYFGLAFDRVFGGIIQDILDLINELEYLSEYEMMFFVSYLGKEYNGYILTKDRILDFITEFRSLRVRSKTVISVMQEYCNPNNFTGNKTTKRDFHNWKNETQTIFDSLNLMSLFEYDERNKNITAKGKINGTSVKFKRSSLIKAEYFKEHKIDKDLQFELHHIVPFYFARSIDELKAIDDWQNLIYIDANSHKRFSLDKKLKQAIRLNFKEDDAILDNLIGDEILLKYGINIKYKTTLQERLLNYNKSLLGL